MLGIMEIISINMIRMEFIVQLVTVETDAAAGLNTLKIVISLTRGVSNILETSMQHGYFIK